MNTMCVFIYKYIIFKVFSSSSFNWQILKNIGAFMLFLYEMLLLLSVEPQILPFAFPEEVEEGQLIQVSCAVTKGDDPLTVQWYKDGSPLSSSPNFMINNVAPKLSILLLSSANADHTGTYSCLAFNPVGTAESSASLKVKGTYSFNFPHCMVLFQVR